MADARYLEDPEVNRKSISVLKRARLDGGQTWWYGIKLLGFAQVAFGQFCTTPSTGVHLAMFSFASFPAPQDLASPRNTKYHPDVDDDLLMDLDIDSKDGGDLSAKLTSPGESLTSAQAFMRCVFDESQDNRRV